VEMQRVPVYKAFYEARYIGSGWQMPPDVKVQSSDLFCEASQGQRKRFAVQADNKLTGVSRTRIGVSRCLQPVKVADVGKLKKPVSFK
jgi:hypothetical protein